MSFAPEQIATLQRFGQRIVDELVRDIKEKRVTKYGPVNASGNLAESVRYEIYDRGLRVYADDYIFYLEKGRKPGKKPPRSAIKEWIIDKGINFDIPIDSLAYLIQRKIGEEGTTIWQQGGSDLVSGIVNNDLINEVQEAMVLDIVRNISSQIVNLRAA